MSLLDDLHGADMLLIDGLHAWQFELDEQGQLRIECMDGRVRRVWRFAAEQLAAAQAGAEPGVWRVADAEGEHELVCLGAISADNEDADEVEEP
ncbi:DUF5629 family protein [Pseudomonas sp. CAU 1711]|uniref:DUF5629 family protein n=1 Tax=Pseudomonas sp. CAU 1711 TaxID=3140356 RepID=UPI0032604EAE